MKDVTTPMDEVSDEPRMIERRDVKLRTRFENPYHDEEAKTHQFHAVYQRGGDTYFLSAPTVEGLKAGLSSLDNVKKVVAVYVGQLVDFQETRAVLLKGF